MSNFRGWILEAIPREAARCIEEEVKFVYVPVSRREAFRYQAFVNYFFPKLSKFNLFIHHRTFLLVANKKNVRNCRNRIWLTHFDDYRDIQRLVAHKDAIDKVFVQNSNLANFLLRHGFSIKQVSIQPGAIDSLVFFSSVLPLTHGNYFLISGDCKPRKNPQYIEWLIRSFPENIFVIHGRGWRDFNNGSFNSLPNLKILDFDLSEQPNLLRNAIALIIVSTNEGGPVSLLESLACGTPVISTENGLAPDFIDFTNGLIVQLNESIDEWHRIFKTAEELKVRVGHTNLLNKPLTWANLGNELYA